MVTCELPSELVIAEISGSVSFFNEHPDVRISTDTTSNIRVMQVKLFFAFFCISVFFSFRIISPSFDHYDMILC
jgi:hypothetical protein